MGMKINKLRKSARDEVCTMRIVDVCNSNTETTVLAHTNTEGGSMGMKTDDFSACFACSDCHAHFDGYKMTQEDRWFYSRRAMVRTWRRWVETGLVSISGVKHD